MEVEEEEGTRIPPHRALMKIKTDVGSDILRLHSNPEVSINPSSVSAEIKKEGRRGREESKKNKIIKRNNRAIIKL